MTIKRFVVARFNELPAVEKLHALAEHPLDLSKEGVLTPERIKKMQCEALGFKLFYGTQRVSEECLEALLELAKECDVLKKNQAMQAGEVINKIEGCESENRMVLHTAMRDFFEDKNTNKPAKEAADLAWAEIEKLKGFLKSNTKFTDFVQVGIGGSDLGPEAICVALKAYEQPNRRVHFLSNVDPDDGARIFKDLDFSKTLFAMVSKSGGTLETLTNQEYVKEQIKKAGLDPKDHMIAITGKGSPMDDPQHYIESFYIWDYIGGRYSATSMVGIVSLAFSIGIDKALEYLRGASAMDKHAMTAAIDKNLPLLTALFGIWNHNFLELPTVAVIPYSQALARFPAHLQQLDMESNGKRIDKTGEPVDFNTGPIIWGEPGTNGQHSFYQSIHQGTTPVPLEMMGFSQGQYGLDVRYEGTCSQKKLLSNLFAQSIALATGQKHKNPNKVFLGNRPNSVLFAKQLTPYMMGALLSYYEHKVDFQGFIWNINSFDQEGVQLGKVLALKIINQFKAQDENKPLGDFVLGAAYLNEIKSFF